MTDTQTVVTSPLQTPEIAKAQASYDAAVHMEGVLVDALNIVREDKRDSFQKLMDLKAEAFRQIESGGVK